MVTTTKSLETNIPEFDLASCFIPQISWNHYFKGHQISQIELIRSLGLAESGSVSVIVNYYISWSISITVLFSTPL